MSDDFPTPPAPTVTTLKTGSESTSQAGVDVGVVMGVPDGPGDDSGTGGVVLGFGMEDILDLRLVVQRIHFRIVFIACAQMKLLRI